jgi:hypothetical protein
VADAVVLLAQLQQVLMVAPVVEEVEQQVAHLLQQV